MVLPAHIEERAREIARSRFEELDRKRRIAGGASPSQPTENSPAAARSGYDPEEILQRLEKDRDQLSNIAHRMLDTAESKGGMCAADAQMYEDIKSTLKDIAELVSDLRFDCVQHRLTSVA